VSGHAVRVILPRDLRRLAALPGEAQLELAGPATLRAVLDALEGRHPVLRGTVRDPAGGARRPYLRFFAGGEDLSHQDLDAPLPPAVAAGGEPLRIVAAIAGGAG
jgi:hypothetical protein